MSLFLLSWKKQDAEIFSNYRPMSLLPCFSKILERLLDKCIDYTCIIAYEILNDKQFAIWTYFYLYGYNR